MEHTLVMRNTSPFELPFKCLLQDLNVANLAGTLPFSVHPQHGVVPPGEAQELVVTFRADHEPVFGVKNMFTVGARARNNPSLAPVPTNTGALGNRDYVRTRTAVVPVLVILRCTP